MQRQFWNFVGEYRLYGQQYDRKAMPKFVMKNLNVALLKNISGHQNNFENEVQEWILT